MGVQLPLPAPTLNPFWIIRFVAMSCIVGRSTFAGVRYSRSENAVDIQQMDTRRTFRANRKRGGFTPLPGNYTCLRISGFLELC